MKLKNEIFTNGFLGALQAVISQRLPIVQTFRLKKFAAQINERAKIYHEARIALCEQHADKDAEGNAKTENGTYVITDMESFNKELKELIDHEEEYDIEPLVLPATIELSVNELAILEQVLAN